MPIPRGRPGRLPQLDGAVRRTVLRNGLQVVTEDIRSTSTYSLGVFVAVGSRHETPSLHGASHFLEHLLFKGTPSRTAEQISAAIESVGGELNAYTAKEHTCFYARVLHSDAELALDVLTDMITHSLITPHDVDAERAVILDEISMHADDPESWRLRRSRPRSSASRGSAARHRIGGLGGRPDPTADRESLEAALSARLPGCRGSGQGRPRPARRAAERSRYRAVNVCPATARPARSAVAAGCSCAGCRSSSAARCWRSQPWHLRRTAISAWPALPDHRRRDGVSAVCRSAGAARTELRHRCGRDGLFRRWSVERGVAVCTRQACRFWSWCGQRLPMWLPMALPRMSWREPRARCAAKRRSRTKARAAG